MSRTVERPSEIDARAGRNANFLALAAITIGMVWVVLSYSGGSGHADPQLADTPVNAIKSTADTPYVIVAGQPSPAFEDARRVAELSGEFPGGVRFIVLPIGSERVDLEVAVAAANQIREQGGLPTISLVWL
jgi:hypothetical protein